MERTTRRELLKLSPLALFGAFAVPGIRESLLAGGREWTGVAQAAVRSSTRLAPTFSRLDLTPLRDFPINAYLTDDPSLDAATWRLKVSGDVSRAGDYSMEQLKALPRVEQITRHICIEGWAVVGAFAGARLSDFLQMVGASPGARFVQVECADDYYEFLDMPSALHPQTLLCYEMYGAPLKPAHGHPLRLQMPTKLGYKQAKYVVELRVTSVLGKRRGYWVDQGYPAFGGL